ncbi:MAG: hypothetical protein KDG55_06515 [Rhodocyclaceae bacterium]|nr:hypothetical protein [Rhodocyclaceae bacterium]
MNFSSEEAALLRQLAHGFGLGRRFGFYAATLLPVVAFGVYGFLKRDYVASSVALLGAIGHIAWRISAETQHLQLYRSIAQKVLAEAERRETA